jgi:nucleotide-binding universal stress UspA family protein
VLKDQLNEMLRSVTVPAKTETFVLSGDPAEEIVKLAETRRAKLIVMGLHSPEPGGQRMGSVTYRVVAQTRTLVLAVPPK